MSSPPYLKPYTDAAQRYGGGFNSLLWASRATQRIRFDALVSLADFADRIVLDAGAGRGDLMAHLLELNIQPAQYIALEAVEPLAQAIEAANYPNCLVVRGDFIEQPQRLFVGADIIVFSGSLNTLQPDTFYTTLRRAFDATNQTLIFNFLCGPILAAAPHLHWYTRAEVEMFVHSLSDHYEILDGYLEGDCTIRVDKPQVRTS